MMNCQRPFLKTAVCIWAFALACSLHAQSPVTISVDTQNPGAAVPADFTGLSFEVSQLQPDENGVHYFRAGNKPLINLFHTLGIKSLRIGGNTSDRDVRKLPGEADLDSLFGFAKAAGVKVVYCLRLHDGDPQTDVQTAKYIMDHYADEMDCFSIGQEPSAYPKIAMTNATRAAEGMGAEFEKYSYSDYAADWKKFADAIIAAVPDVKFCGPSVHNNGEWAVKFMRDFGRSNHVALITEHLYPGGAGGKIPSPEIGIDRMLSDGSAMTNSFPRAYQKLYDSFVPVAVSNGLPYRLEEVNNYFNGGATNVSNTFASALWGLDFSWWWATHNAAGLNFHTGDKVAAGGSFGVSKYTAYFTSTNGYYVRPLGYGIKAFDLGGRGRILPVTISNPGGLNLSAYAVLGERKSIYVTIINREHGTNARAAEIAINVHETGVPHAQVMFLTAPGGDVAATSGETLGGAAIQNDGNWNGTWASVDDSTGGVFHVRVPAASAAVVACTSANYDEAKVGAFTLPDPLILQNDGTVSGTNDWANLRRPQILKLYRDDIYGSSPGWRNMIDHMREFDGHALGGTARRKQVDLEFYNYASTNKVVFHVLLYTPAGATKPVPTFLCLSFTGNQAAVADTNVFVYPVWDRKTDAKAMPANIDRGASHNWPVEKIIGRGYGIALVDYNDIEPDLSDGSGWRYGVRSLYLKPGETNTASDSWGAISAWAWGASRVLDYLQTDPNVDAQRVIMVGHSRLGKTALWAGAQDPRFAMVIASCSGEMGASLSRRDYGETVTSMCKGLAYQFCGNFLAYSNHISDLPVDSHMLIALIAPRPLYLNTGSEDRWGDPRGEFEAAIAAAPVYRLFGRQSVVTNLPPVDSVNGSGPGLASAVLESYLPPPLDVPVMHDIGFQTHTGGHDILPEDWNRFLDFADLHFYGKPPHQYPADETKTKPE
jgi:hypothetical protein